MSYPIQRLRRLRMSPLVRDLVRETHLVRDDFIYPLFVCEGQGVRQEIGSMPGVCRLSIDELAREVETAAGAGIKAIMLFGIPADKDDAGTSGYRDDGIVQRAVAALKERRFPVVLITDVCLCEYTSHGHCGVVRDGMVANDESVRLLVRQALSHVRAGADMVAPSDMMDGRVGAIRSALDENGYENVAILSYAAKYASGFYGPFREAAGSAPAFGDRRSHQMDPANVEEALREVALDIDEGADIVMVKPALAYLDVIRRVKERFQMPVAAYNVSGEYSMVEIAARAGALDHDRVMLEILTSIKRAGADLILTYHAVQAARLL